MSMGGMLLIYGLVAYGMGWLACWMVHADSECVEPENVEDDEEPKSEYE